MEGIEGLASFVPTRMSCAAHMLQLVVKDGIKAVGHGAVSKALTRVNGFIGSARKSTNAMEVLSKAKTSLQAANVTRWSSQLRAVQSFLALPEQMLQDLRALDTAR